jgi:hypothetical protein
MDLPPESVDFPSEESVVGLVPLAPGRYPESREKSAVAASGSPGYSTRWLIRIDRVPLLSWSAGW